MRASRKWKVGNGTHLPVSGECILPPNGNRCMRKLSPTVERFEIPGRGTAVGTPYPPTSRRYAVYHRAVDRLRYVPRLFEHVYTGTRADRKKALEASDISSLVRETERSQEGRSQTHSRTRIFFVLMFMLRGIPFGSGIPAQKGPAGECAVLQKAEDGTLTVYSSPEAMQMVRMVANRNPTPYLSHSAERGRYGSGIPGIPVGTQGFNQRLAVLRQCLGMQSALSTYAADTPGPQWLPLRDTPGIISEAMGHSSITVTETYLKPFSNRKIDEANQRVISL